VAVVRVSGVFGSSCPRCQSSGWQLSGWQLSWLAVVLGGSFPGWRLP